VALGPLGASGELRGRREGQALSLHGHAHSNRCALGARSVRSGFF
jgi:hypothetical protein